MTTTTAEALLEILPLIQAAASVLAEPRVVDRELRTRGRGSPLRARDRAVDAELVRRAVLVLTPVLHRVAQVVFEPNERRHRPARAESGAEIDVRLDRHPCRRPLQQLWVERERERRTLICETCPIEVNEEPDGPHLDVGLRIERQRERGEIIFRHPFGAQVIHDSKLHGLEDNPGAIARTSPRRRWHLAEAQRRGVALAGAKIRRKARPAPPSPDHQPGARAAFDAFDRRQRKEAA